MKKGRLVLLRGLPGAGKSTLAERMQGEEKDCEVLSADSFFVNEATGRYEFNHTGLETAHIRCQEQCRWEMERGRAVLIVDNCSLTARDAAPYVVMAQASGYEVDIVDVEGECAAEELAVRNTHNVSADVIRSLAGKMERYTVTDCLQAAKTMHETKETTALRKKWAQKVRESVEPVTMLAAKVGGKIRLEVCANNGQAHPVKAVVVAEGTSIADITKQAAKKAGLTFSAKSRLFDNVGKDVERVCEGMRVFVSADGKDFIPMKLKQTAAERRAAKLHALPAASVATTKSGAVGALASMHKLSSGCVEIVEGLFIGSGRDGRDVEQLDALQIDTVINVAKDWPLMRDEKRRWINLGLLDEPHARLDHVVAPAFAAILSGSRVLVHCITGISRSATVIAAFLIVKRGYSTVDAIKLLRAKRECVSLNPAFVVNLIEMEACVTGNVLPDVQLGEALLENGSDPRSFLKKVGRRPEGDEKPSHIWWTPQFRPEDSYVVPGALRNALAVVNWVCPSSNVVEMRSAAASFRLHFDIDVSCKEPQFESIEAFWGCALLDFRAVLSDKEFGCLFVSGAAGPWRGRFKYGLHLTCADVLVTEDQFHSRIDNFRSDLAARQCGWAHGGAWDDIVDSMTSVGIRCLGSDRVVACDSCRKAGSVARPDCDWCFGKGMEPVRRHKILYPKNSEQNVGAFSIFPPFYGSPLTRAFLGLEATNFANSAPPKRVAMRVLEYLDANGKEAPTMMAKAFQLDVSRHQEHRNLLQFCYSKSNSMLRDPLVQECRGIVVAQDESRRNWSIVAMPFLKFFNLDDTRAGEEFDWDSKVEVSEKLDGMMTMLYRFADDWHVASMSVPDGSNVIQGGQTVRQLFFEAFEACGYKLASLPIELSFIFELLSPSVKVVIPHEKNELVLIGARNMISLEEENVLAIAAQLGMVAAPRFRFASKMEIVQSKYSFLSCLFILSYLCQGAARINGLVCEGYVARDEHGNRLKIKAPSYVALHHLQSGKAEATDLARVVLNNEHEEVSIYFPHLKPKLDAFARALSSVESPHSLPLAELAKRLSKLANVKDVSEEAAAAERKSKAEKQKEKAARKEAKKADKQKKR